MRCFSGTATRHRRDVIRRALGTILSALLLVTGFTVAAPGALSRAAHDVSTGITAAVHVASTRAALIMNGTFEPVVTPQWITEVMDDLVTPVLGAGYTGEPVNTPEEFWPLTGLTSRTFNQSVKTGYDLLEDRVGEKLQDSPTTALAVFGYSQSALIADVLKLTLAQEYAGAETVPPVSLVMLANPLRPNGGILSRIALVADILAPWAGMNTTPTDTAFSSYDIARQYDIWSDFPTYPLNLLSTVNAVFGLMNHWYLPESANGLISPFLDMVSLDPASPNYNPDTTVQRSGDTTYYTIPSTNLPMFYPLRWIGLGPLVDVFEPLVRVFVELGYDRSAAYGDVVRARLLPDLRDLAHAGQFVADIDSALQQGAQALQRLFRPTNAPLPAPSTASSTAPSPATVTAMSGPPESVATATETTPDSMGEFGPGEPAPLTRPRAVEPRQANPVRAGGAGPAGPAGRPHLRGPMVRSPDRHGRAAPRPPGGARTTANAAR